MNAYGALHGNARFIARIGREDELGRRLLHVVVSARREEGNLGLHMYRSTAEPAVFYLHSVWRDAAALETHFAQPYVIDFFASAPELEAEPNTVDFGRMISNPAPEDDGLPVASPERLYGIARFLAKSGSEDALERTLLDSVEPSRGEAGNLRYDVFRSDDQPALFGLHEAWSGEDAVLEHADRPHARRAQAVLRTVLAEPFWTGFGVAVGESRYDH